MATLKLLNFNSEDLLSKMANFTAMKVKKLGPVRPLGNDKGTNQLKPAEACAGIVSGFVTRNTPVTNWPFFPCP